MSYTHIVMVTQRNKKENEKISGKVRMAQTPHLSEDITAAGG
jgi:hypothetical protein